MRRVCAQGPIVKGIDVSHYQSDVNWSYLKKSSIEFAFIKATEGLTIVDPTFHYNWGSALDKGILRGAYHFYRPNDNPEAQADAFCKTVGSISGASDLPCVLDWESVDPESSYVLGTKETDNILQFLSTVKDNTNRVPIIYGSPSFLSSQMCSPFVDYPLWIANYGVSCPYVPYPWQTWTFWQTSQNSYISENRFDLNYFNGTIDQLKAL